MELKMEWIAADMVGFFGVLWNIIIQLGGLMDVGGGMMTIMN
jgi:hypothetical protein